MNGNEKMAPFALRFDPTLTGNRLNAPNIPWHKAQIRWNQCLAENRNTAERLVGAAPAPVGSPVKLAFWLTAAGRE
jgi:hypothetical protein